MAATAEAGSDKSDSLSRSAKMVMASSTNKQQTPKRQFGDHGNSSQSPGDNSARNNADRQEKKGPTRKDDLENVQKSSPTGHHSNSYCGDGNQGNKNSPEPRWQQTSKRDSPSGFNRDQRETEMRQPTKRPSILSAETSPSKVKKAVNPRPFKQVAEEFLTSFDRRLLDLKLSDIRPVLEKQLGHKLSKEEKETLKELAVERVDVLIKNGSSETPIHCLKPKPASVGNTAADSTSSTSKDIVDMEFRCCPKCQLQFTARQITGHVLSCQGNPSAVGVSKATKASTSAQRGRRGRGRGRGGGGTRGRKSFSAASDGTAVSTHVRAAQMPRYQREGAVAKRKRGGRGANLSPRNPTSSSFGKQQPGGFLQTSDISPQQPVTRSPQEGALTARQYNFDSLGNSPESFPPSRDSRIDNETSASRAGTGCQNGGRNEIENEERLPCPICCQSYPVEVIEIHADMCLEQTQILNELSNQQTACF